MLYEVGPSKTDVSVEEVLPGSLFRQEAVDMANESEPLDVGSESMEILYQR